MKKLLDMDPSMVSAIGTWICAATLVIGFLAIIILIDRAIDNRYQIGDEENGY